MDAQQLFEAGKLSEAIPALNSHLRDNPGDLRSRTFLFELLCFAGDFDRADKQLTILQQEGNQESIMGSLLYRAAIHAERIRQDMFEAKSFPKQVVNGVSTFPVQGKLNGKPFQTIGDSDPRIGEKLEVFAGGDYLWISYSDIASIRLAPPKKLRDLLWAPARIAMNETLRSRDLGEVLLPVISPLSWQHPDDAVRLGRTTEWCADEAGEEAPYGLKSLLVDGEEFPFLEIRTLEFEPAATSQARSTVG